MPSCYYREEGRGCRHVITGRTEEVTVMLLLVVVVVVIGQTVGSIQGGRTGLPSEKKNLYSNEVHLVLQCVHTFS